ncbi:hypothetical protein BBK82_04170 [Lentzea guizhouensis]|uniref:Uncharacterized protein n=1 Tax=Lentzea guizhouensis TaxID=1586287 RepID=A0A1B2HCE7_9PSEU|nr:hypothetical protein [Lentzea guizhouensis]ANZ35401.1 hypothetical protein BBK82_04170 [Lentzea guizhouensis]
MEPRERRSQVRVTPPGLRRTGQQPGDPLGAAAGVPDHRERDGVLVAGLGAPQDVREPGAQRLFAVDTEVLDPVVPAGYAEHGRENRVPVREGLEHLIRE